MNDTDKEYLKYEILIEFCKKHNITDIDAMYYLKIAYENIKNEIDDIQIFDFLENIYLALEEHFYTNFINNK